MNIYEEELFISVVNNKSFFKAAKQNGITYQNVRYHIDNLEREFDTIFFNRSNSGCILTKDGEIFYDYAKINIEQYNNLKNKLHNNNLVIGVKRDFMQPIISNFYERFKDDTRIIYKTMDYNDLHSALLADKIDCYFGYEKEYDKSLFFEKIYNDNLCLMINKANILIEKSEININEIRDLFIDLSMNKSIISILPIDDLLKYNKIITNSDRAVFDHNIIFNNAASIVAQIYNKYSSKDFLFIPLKDYNVEFGVFYKNESFLIKRLIGELKIIANDL